MAQLIEEITSSPLQKLQFELEDGTTFDLNLNYRVQQQGWFIDISYSGFILNGIRVALNINLLAQFENIIPFGLMVSANDKTEPVNINDFDTGRVSLSVLNAEEVEQINDFLGSQKDGAGEV